MSLDRASRAVDALDPTRPILVGLDFDGTLSPIVPRPELALLPLAARRALARLARKPRAHVAIVSGRGLDDVRLRVGLDGLHYAGNHGLEIAGPLLRWRHPLAAARREELARLIRHLRREIVIDGVLLEHKELGLSVHYRMAQAGARETLRSRLARALRAAAPRFRLAGGHMVWEVRPRARWDKGHALRRIAQRLGRRTQTMFAGDDVSDEEAFRTLGPRALTIRVGGAGPTAARFRVEGPADVRRLLERLARRLPD